MKSNAGDPEKLDLVEEISRPGYEMLNEMKSPRFIKTHFPLSLLPPNLLDVGCKVYPLLYKIGRKFGSSLIKSSV
jgi:hypothetical protein